MTSARPDTRFLCSSTLTADLSQRATNLTASTTAAFETNSARTTMDPTEGRSLELSVELDTSHAGALLHIGTSPTVSTALIEITDPGVISFAVNNTYIASLDAPNADGTAKTYVVGWSSEANPETTGASDAVRSELTVYDVDGNDLARVDVTHATGSPASTMEFVVGGWWDGAKVANKANATINAARVSARYHTRSETREHFVAQTSAPTVTGVSAVELQPVPADVCVAGALVGPQIQHASQAVAVGRNRHRLVGPLVSGPHWPLVAWQSSLTEAVSASWVRTLSDGFATNLGWTWRRRVPYHAEWILGTLQWAAWNTEAEAVDVTMRLYCSRNPPHLAQASEWTVVELTRTNDDGVGGGFGGTGALEQFDPLLVRRDADGVSWLWLGLSITEATPLATKVNPRWLSLVSFTRPTLGDQLPNAWGP